MCRIVLFILLIAATVYAQSQQFVSIEGSTLRLDGKPYYFVGANYWYGSLLGLEKDKKRGIERLRRELDFLKAHGVTNLRLMAGAEGSGLLNGVLRVGPSLQPEQGKFDETVLDGLDLALYEMGKRKMKAVIFLSNNWEWSGGFQQYLLWNQAIPADLITRKPDWDELRDAVAKFYTCEPCKAGYNKQAELILSRTNKYTRRKYVEDPAIMAWELANEPRPMRPFANDTYRKWITDTAAMIKSHDHNHLVTTGHEGRIGTESLALFEQVHIDKNIDYLTIHIWPKNWGWFTGGKLADTFQNAVTETVKYIDENAAVAVSLNKPLVIEEFGLPRDNQAFDPASTTKFRDMYYKRVLSSIATSNIAGANFWAFGGTARPVKDQIFWQEGDDLMGDPPMEEQGLNSVFDSDASTWKIIADASAKIRKRPRP